MTFVENVNRLATNLTDAIVAGLDFVVANGSEIAAVGTMQTEVLQVYADRLAILSVYADKITLDSLYADKATLDSIFADKPTLDSLFADKLVLDSLYADKAVLDRIFASIAEIDRLHASIAGIDALVLDILNVDIAANNIADIITVATNILDVNNFADTYHGALAVAPTIGTHPSLSAGDLYFDTVLVQLRVYDGGVWTAAGSTVSGIDRTEQFVVGTPSGLYDGVSTTVFPLAEGYDGGFATVIWNGTVLADEDVDITSGVSVTILSTDVPVAGDIIKVIAYGAFALADHYTKAESDILHRAVPIKVKAGETLVRGDVVKASSYVPGEDALVVVKTVAQTDIAIGIVRDAIVSGSFGDIVTRGIIEGLDTSMYNFGDILYSAGSGGFTTTKPTTAYQAVAYVVKDSAGNGTIMANATEPVENKSKLWDAQTTTHDFTTDADYTLTATQNLYGRIILTDTGVVLTTGRNLITDNVPKLFIIQNDTLQDKTVKTLAGTGILVPVGTSRRLYNDGTSIVEPDPFIANDDRVKTSLNASGLAPIYATRTWVNFNGTGTIAIRNSGNVSSLVDNGTGDYTANLIIAIEDTNYSITYGGRRDTTGATAQSHMCIKRTAGAITTTSVSVQCFDTTSTLRDFDVVNIEITR